ncbi:hypothetical protein LTR56_020508 [Elasticomyces elasticus]|nr:hypothetical protein LTR22_024296 [Elasticomyces elasticus]KAK3625247.1 hypothetical protein LTR56_020508 [Elasticomyces elasticus]KAK4906190.1 hypothetical protein LTR49_024633 [Elasticomyces elasticus]KAK5744079.1 hypothetical protein LTS12_023613 [Elasticomyces elasticus]
MPLRPFPFQMGIGTDIVHAPRIQTLISKGEGKARTLNLYRFMNHLLSSREQQLFWNSFGGTRNVYGPKLDTATKWLAGRWAAKEAVIKAVQYRRLSFLDVEILPVKPTGVSGPVYAVILDKSADARKIDDAYPSLSRNEDGEATATVSDHENGGERTSNDGSSDQATQNIVYSPDGDNEQPDGQVAKVNISHDGEYVTAVCLAADQPREGDVGGEAAAREPWT